MTLAGRKVASSSDDGHLKRRDGENALHPYRVTDCGYRIPTASLDLTSVAPRRRMDMWRAYNAGLFELKPLISPRQEFDASAMSYRFGNCIIGEFSTTGNIVRRNLRSLSIDGEGLLVLRMHRAGYTRGVMNDLNFEMRSDRLTLFDFHQSLHAKTEGVDYVSFTCPHQAVGYDPSIHPRFMQIKLNTPAGRILKSNLELMLELLPNAKTAEAISLSEGLCGMLRGLITRDLRDETAQARFARSREVAVRRFLSANLKDPGLDADAICEAVGISRAVLYRLFDREGGVRKAILVKRLEHALDELAQSEPRRGVVAKVAQHWAFHDQAHFSRLFRETFGLRPSDVVGTALVEASSPSDEWSLKVGPSRGLIKPLTDLYGPRREDLAGQNVESACG